MTETFGNLNLEAKQNAWYVCISNCVSASAVCEDVCSFISWDKYIRQGLSFQQWRDLEWVMRKQ